MSEVVYWLGDAGETTAKVCFRVDTVGTYRATLNGVDVDVALDPAVNYGVGAASFSGLQANTPYPFTIKLAGALQASGTAHTMPAAGSHFNVCFFSCMSLDCDPIALYQAIDRYDCRAAFAIGDIPYLDVAISNRFPKDGLTRNGVYTNHVSADTWHEQYLVMHRDLPGFRHLAERAPLYRMWDDHDSLGNDYDHELAHTNAQPFAPAFATQADVDTAFNLARTAFDVWSIGNPVTDWLNAANQKPYGADAGTSAANYPPQYFTKVIGDSSFHVIDCISHRGTIAQADGGESIEDISTAKTMLGLPQLRGLKAQLMRSATDFNVIVSSKVTYRGNSASDNHGWNDTVTERAHLLEWIRKFARGVVWAAGDVHTPHVINGEHHALVCACPVSMAEQDGTSSPDLGTGYAESVAWKADGYNDDNWEGTPRVIGIISCTPTYLDWKIVTDGGVELCCWRQHQGSNSLVRIW